MAHDVSANEYKLDTPPTDCIQSVKFSQLDSHHLLTASWDCTVRLYDVSANKQRIQYTHEAPVFDVAFQGNNWCWSGGADNQLKRFDFQSYTDSTVGYHNEPIRVVEYVSDVNLVASGGWDSQLKLWDPRLSDSSQLKPIASHLLPDKVYTMSVCGDKLIIGTAGRKVVIWDLKMMTHELRESQIKYQIRCIKAFADHTGFVVSSIEGRVAVEYLDQSPEIQKQRYAFKCHRNKDSTTGMEFIYPVNAISFHQKYNTFATGGSDGYVSVWDGQKKKRIVQFHKYPTSISSLSFSPDGHKLAIACSNLHAYEETDTIRDIPPACIYIRRVSDQETKNKN